MRLLSRTWEVEAGAERYVCRQVDAGGRTALAAALAAAQPLRDHGVEVGRPGPDTRRPASPPVVDGGALAVSAPARPAAR